jgi:two-component system, OmpR family, phosphate regulon sensor histidine kinase PhoR
VSLKYDLLIGSVFSALAVYLGIVFELSPVIPGLIISLFIARILTRILMAQAEAVDRQKPSAVTANAQAHLPGVANDTVAILDAIAAPCLIVDERGVIQQANTAAKSEFSGFASGMGLRGMFRSAAINDALQVAVKTGRAVCDYTERRPQERSFQVSIRQISGQASRFVCHFASQTEALRVDRMRSDFIANASHELRTPLTAVMGFLETIDGPARNDQANREKFVKLMLAQTQRMARLVDDLLSLSRLESQTAPIQLQKLDLGLLVASCCDAMAGLAKSDNVEIDNKTPRGSLFVDGDRDELTQVIQNLIENAIKYGASGKRIIISAANGLGNETGIMVQDFGPGIASEHIPRLTERFYRVDVEASRLQKGTGLGLAIVKHIISRHRGRLLIESAPGKGSRFSVLFPKADQ